MSVHPTVPQDKNVLGVIGSPTSGPLITLNPVSHSFSSHIEKGDTTGVWICSKYPGFIEYQFEQCGRQKQ